MTAFYRVLITGSRDWPSWDAVDQALDRLLIEHGSITVVHGDCPTGADFMARGWAERNILAGMGCGEAWTRHEAYLAPWGALDKAAGPIRNKYMTQLGADECLAFPLPASRGTISCMKLAWAAGIPITNLGTLPEGVVI